MLAPSRLAKIISILIAVFVGSVFIDSWLLQPKRLEHLCGLFPVGTSINELPTRAQEYSVKLIESPGSDNQTKLITLHGGSFNQYICEIHHDGEKVIQNEFKKASVRNR